MRIIAGEYGGRVLKTTSGPGYRPAMGKVRQALFSMLEARGIVWQDCRVLDLYAGSGALAFEALSRGAKHAWFVEMAPKAAALIRTNAEKLGIPDSRWQVFSDDVGKFLAKKPPHRFDVVFIDPPYGKNFLAPSMRNLLKFRWLEEDGFVCAEVEEKLPLPNDHRMSQLDLLVDKLYGQTRILVWAATESE